MEPPTDPPSYETIDVVQEFTLRFEKRKETIHNTFDKKRVAIDTQHNLQLAQLEKERSKALVQLHTSYLEWINVEPPIITIPQPHLQQQPITYSKWLRSFFR